MTRLLAVRHGESEVNRNHCVPGQSLPSPLTDTGWRQALATAGRLGAVITGSATVISSDAVRAVQTAEPIAKALRCQIHTSPLLREQDLGELEGKPVSQMTSLPVPQDAHITEIAWGGGESIADVYARLARFVDELRQGELPPTVVLVTHADAIRVLHAVIDQAGHRNVDWSKPGLDFAEYTQIDWTP